MKLGCVGQVKISFFSSFLHRRLQACASAPRASDLPFLQLLLARHSVRVGSLLPAFFRKLDEWMETPLKGTVMANVSQKSRDRR